MSNLGRRTGRVWVHEVASGGNDPVDHIRVEQVLQPFADDLDG
jgi:hypothetical protein